MACDSCKQFRGIKKKKLLIYDIPGLVRKKKILEINIKSRICSTMVKTTAVGLDTLSTNNWAFIMIIIIIIMKSKPLQIIYYYTVRVLISFIIIIIVIIIIIIILKANSEVGMVVFVKCKWAGVGHIYSIFNDDLI